MSFTLWGTTYTDLVTKIDAAFLNYMAASIADAVDGVGGGTYNLLAGHTLAFPTGGGNISIGAEIALGDIALAEFTGSTLFTSDSATMISGSSGHVATWTWGAYSTVTVNGTSGAHQNWTFGQYSDVLVNGSLDVTSAATFAINTNVQLGSGGTLKVGTVGAGSVGHILVQYDSDITIEGTSGHEATLTIGANGAVAALAGSTISQAGTRFLNGPGAYDQHRAPTTLADASDLAWDPTIADVFRLPDPGSDRTLKIATGLPVGYRFKITAPGSMSNGFEIQNSAASPVAAFGSGVTDRMAAEFQIIAGNGLLVVGWSPGVTVTP